MHALPGADKAPPVDLDGFPYKMKQERRAAAVTASCLVKSPQLHIEKRDMQPYTAIIVIAVLAATARAGQLLGAYNLVPASLSLQPQTYSVIPGILSAPQQQAEDISHPAVVENAIAESQLPPELLNPFYKNPGVASALAKESWFTNKEFLVRHREAEKIPRQEIYKIISRLQHRR